MKAITRKKFNAWKDQVAKLNKVGDATEKFAVDPSIGQKLEEKVQESSAFLGSVNSIPVDEQTGEKLGLSATSTVAGRTNTNNDDRETQDPTGLDKHGYACKQTNFDTHVRYDKLDMWAKFPDFQTRFRNQVVNQIGRDRQMIGFNGTSAAADTDRVVNPLLQDVNIGWLEKIKTEDVARYMTEGAVTGEIRVGAGGDYENMDALIHDMRNNLLDPWHRRDNMLIPIMSSDMLDEKYFPLIQAHSATPTESNSLDDMISNKRVGGLRPAEVPFFPERTVLITHLGSAGDSNLSVYWQEGTRRQTILDNAKRDRIENFQSVNEAYVVEDLGACAVATNIKVPNAAGTGWV